MYIHASTKVMKTSLLYGSVVYQTMRITNISICRLPTTVHQARNVYILCSIPRTSMKVVGLGGLSRNTNMAIVLDYEISIRECKTIWVFSLVNAVK